MANLKDETFFEGKSRALKILMVMRAPLGGLFRHVLDLSKGLIDRGHHVGILYHGKNISAQSQAKLDEISSQADLGLHDISMPRTLGFGDISTHRFLSKFIKAQAIDIVHGHGAKGGFHARLAGRAKLGRVKTARLYTPHGGVLHYDRAKLSGKIFLSIEEFLLAKADAMVFESQFAARTFEEKIGAPKNRSSVIYNGLQAHELEPVDIIDGENPFFEGLEGPADFSFVGELRELKGVHILLKALNLIGRRTGKIPTAILAGSGPERTHFEELANDLGLQNFVRFVGQQPARKIFAAGKYLIVPSLNESLPYVILEASGGQVPVISTKVGGISEIFGPTKNELVSADDVNSLAYKMQEALDEPDKMDDLALQRYGHIQTNFNVLKMVEEMEDLYYQALNGY